MVINRLLRHGEQVKPIEKFWVPHPTLGPADLLLETGVRLNSRAISGVNFTKRIVLSAGKAKVKEKE